MKLLSQFRQILNTSREVFTVIPKRLRFAFGAVGAGALALWGFEFGFAILLQLLLIRTGLLPSSAMTAGSFLSDMRKEYLAIGLILLATIRGFGQFIIAQSTTFLQHAWDGELRLLASYDLLKKNPPRFISSAEMSGRMSELFPRAGEFLSHFCHYIAQTMQLVGLFVMMIYFAWQPTVFALVSCACFAFFLSAISGHVSRMSANVIAEESKIFGNMARVIKNWIFVRMIRNEAQEHQSLRELLLKRASSYLKVYALANFSVAVPGLFGIVLVVGLIFLNKQVFGIPGFLFISFLYVFIRFTQHVSSLSYNHGMLMLKISHFEESVRYAKSFNSSERAVVGQDISRVNPVGGLFETELAHSHEVPKLLKGGDGKNKLPSIELDQVSYSYDKKSDPIFEKFSLKIGAGEHFGITGRSGAGKSTLFGLMLGFLKPNSGNIKIGGHDASHEIWRTQIKAGFVGTDPFVIEGSIYENLIYAAKSKISEAECWKALKDVGLAGEIKSLPEQLGSQISENGSGLSSGQKQRLALARSLLGKPELLFLDEASANLDEESEAIIAETISRLRGQCTVVIISHRQGLLKHTDRCLDLHDRKIKTTKKRRSAA